jgi:magnesium-protoporphyrin O-methyltransferase
MFTASTARRDLDRYRAKGIGRLERRIVASVVAAGVDGRNVLEIGGGVGALQAELMAAGASAGEVVELVAAYEPYARELAAEKGLAKRVTFRVADVLDDPSAASPADVVVLNRVVCCSPDGVELASVASCLARRTLVLSYPRDRALVRLGFAAINLGQRLLGRSFRAFVHSPARLRAAAEAEGLQLRELGGGPLWEFSTMERVA